MLVSSKHWTDKRRGSLPPITQSVTLIKYPSDGDTIVEEEEEEREQSNTLPRAGNEDQKDMYADLAGELEEWYRTTLSSANLPFHMSDPRRRGSQFSLRPYTPSHHDSQRWGSVLDWRRQGHLERRRTSEVKGIHVRISRAQFSLYPHCTILRFIIFLFFLR